MRGFRRARQRANNKRLPFIEVIGFAGASALCSGVFRTARKTAISFQFVAVAGNYFPNVCRSLEIEPFSKLNIANTRFIIEFDQ